LGFVYVENIKQAAKNLKGVAVRTPLQKKFSVK
jgi:hypothetical protein